MLVGVRVGGLGVVVGVMVDVVVVGLFVGLGEFMKHFILRWLLAYYKHLPFHLVPFLEFAKERPLLRRVGGGYIFIHRTLLEYFATQDTNFDSPSN